MKRKTASSYQIGNEVKGLFDGEPELHGVVTDRTSTTIFVLWEGYGSPLEYSSWQFDYITISNVPKKHS